ncbi:MAG: DEAD/DEAH box helicase family protein, partial [Clostridiales bacterium]|nr:DEAD/DEAH box helicase family protein [Clostridiales bacterium]
MQGIFTVAKIALCNTLYSFDKEYSYSVPKEYKEKVLAGMRVLVPFGRGNTKRMGFITSTYESETQNPKLKPILNVIDEKSLVNDEMLKMIFWLKENTFCTYYDAFRTVVPSGFSYKYKQRYALVNAEISEPLTEEESLIVEFLKTAVSLKEIDSFLDFNINPEKKKIVESLVDKGIVEEIDEFKRKVGDETIKMVAITDGYYNGSIVKKLTKKQHLVVELLEEYETASVKEVCYMTNVTTTIIKNLIKAGVLYEFEHETLRSAIDLENCNMRSPDDIILNDEQSLAFNGISDLINKNKPAGALLFGVTGSGKTSVFIKLIDSVLKENKSAILMVPEIALTPQMVGEFISLYGDTVAVIHSNLSLGQRVDEF